MGGFAPLQIWVSFRFSILGSLTSFYSKSIFKFIVESVGYCNARATYLSLTRLGYRCVI